LIALIAVQIDHRFRRRIDEALHARQLLQTRRAQQLGLFQFQRSAVQLQTLPLLPQSFRLVARHQTIQRWKQQRDHHHREGERRSDHPPADFAGRRIRFAMYPRIVDVLHIQVHILVRKRGNLEGVLIAQNARPLRASVLGRREPVQHSCETCHYDLLSIISSPLPEAWRFAKEGCFWFPLMTA
jgi:hypothetical protein